MVKLVRVSDETFSKIQKVQKVRETYGQVVERAISFIIEKELKKK